MFYVSELASIKPGGFDPVRRVAAVHAATLNRHDCGVCPRSCIAAEKAVPDGRQCRIWLNEAQREIDRLRRGIAEQPSVKIHARLDGDTFTPSAKACDSPTSPQRTQPMYAPPALGDVSHLEVRQPPPPPPQPVPIENHFHITNLGSLLDVLA